MTPTRTQDARALAEYGRRLVTAIDGRSTWRPQQKCREALALGGASDAMALRCMAAVERVCAVIRARG